MGKWLKLPGELYHNKKLIWSLAKNDFKTCFGFYNCIIFWIDAIHASTLFEFALFNIHHNGIANIIVGTIAKSGSLSFKNENELTDDVDVIGQFGVGFYSA